MIQKGLACRWQQSGSVARLDEAAWACGWILPCRLHCHCGASVVTAAIVVANRMEDPVKLTDTQLLLLSAASQRDDRALEPSPKLTGGAAGNVVAKLLTEGLVEEVRARGSIPVWRRDDDGPRALRMPALTPHMWSARGPSSSRRQDRKSTRLNSKHPNKSY